MKGMLDPYYEEKVIGHAQVSSDLQGFRCWNHCWFLCTGWYVPERLQVRITREGEQIYEGPLASLKRFKDDVKEVKAGYECGLVFEKFNDLQD